MEHPQPKFKLRTPKASADHRYHKVTNLLTFLQSTPNKRSWIQSRQQWLTLSLVLLILPALVFATTQTTFLQNIRAVLSPVPIHISVSPILQAITTQGEASILAQTPSDKHVGFVQMTLTFDPNQIQIVQITPNPHLPDSIFVSTPAQANQSGQIQLNLSTKPDQIVSPPQNTFEIVHLEFTNISKQTNTTTKILLSPVDTKIFATDTTPFQVTTRSGTIILNPPK